MQAALESQAAAPRGNHVGLLTRRREGGQSPGVLEKRAGKSSRGVGTPEGVPEKGSLEQELIGKQEPVGQEGRSDTTDRRKILMEEKAIKSHWACRLGRSCLRGCGRQGTERGKAWG